jgi:hypothetical protein
MCPLQSCDEDGRGGNAVGQAVSREGEGVCGVEALVEGKGVNNVGRSRSIVCMLRIQLSLMRQVAHLAAGMISRGAGDRRWGGGVSKGWRGGGQGGGGGVWRGHR